MVSSGDRSAKIRTYNYPQGRITEHRIGLTIYDLPKVINGDIQKIISDVDNSLIKKVLIFDVFEGENMPEGKKSIAVNVTIQSMEKTLSEKDLNEVSQKIINIVKAKTGGTIRS